MKLKLHRSHRSLFLALNAAAISVMAGCVKTSPESSTEWAHFSPMALTGGTFGQLEVIRQKMPSNISNINICVETKKGVDDANLIFETKLAYAAWINGSKNYNETDWQKLHFVGMPLCDVTDAKWNATVILVDPAVSKTANFATQFASAFAACHLTNEGNLSFETALLEGLGKPGSYSARGYEGGYWVQMAFDTPSLTMLSQYVRWHSLENELTGNKQLTDASRAQLLKMLATLKAQANPTLSDLSAFNDLLASLKLLSTKDGTMIPAILKTAQNSHPGDFKVSYFPDVTMFHVMLHEVGHQFGMDHADNPDAGDVTGNSGSGKLVNGVWTSSDATMAYGNEYLYLTADDLAGARDASNATRAYVKSKLPPPPATATPTPGSGT